MFSISFRNRIALYFSITTAILIAVIFIIIFFIVKAGMYKDLDNDLQKELDNLYTEITINRDGFWVEKEEWYEKEHNTLDINPIFIQFMDNAGMCTDRSPNLKKSYLRFRPYSSGESIYDSTLDSISVRQQQTPIKFKGKIVGHIIVAVPLKSAHDLISGLQGLLLTAYPVILFVLFSIARLLAGKGIRPVTDIINATQKISPKNLSARIPHPKNKDILYTLSGNINSLLNRIENAVIREKQFTSDASHELRTPLSVIRGTLEVLIRKPRTSQEYVEKIKFTITELDRINALVDQLLLLARLESQKETLKKENVNINTILLDIISRNSGSLQDKGLNVKNSVPNNLFVLADSHLLTMVLENLISNAIKYSNDKSTITIHGGNENMPFIEITDNGIGIAAEDMDKIFNSFYRSKPHEHLREPGSGLGLSIVKRICELLEIEISIESQLKEGTKIKLTLKQNRPLS